VSNDAAQDYTPGLEYLRELPERARYLGDASKGEAQIVARPDDPGLGGTGILIRDDFHTVVRDAVLYPSGAVKTPMRIIGATSADGPGGVTVLASLDGRIQLRWMFRHATRRWELEAARGRRETGESPEQAARKETEEELGMRATTVERLGGVASETSLLASEVENFWAEVVCDDKGDDPEPGEAMGEIESLTPAELWDRVREGVVRDAHTLTAILHAVARGKLPAP